MIRIFTLLIFITFLSCANSEENTELDVINDTFLELVGTDYFLEPLPIPPYSPFHPDSLAFEMDDDPLVIDFDGITDTIKFDYEELRKREIEEYESFDWKNYYKEVEVFEDKLKNRKPDTSRLVVLVKDTLITVKRTRLLNSILTEKGFKGNFEVDSTWRTLAIKLVDSISNSQKINIIDITETGRYDIENEENYEVKESERLIGYVTFSRVAFNKELSKGCFYFKFFCGGECGEGVMVFVENINRKWNIVGVRNLWVS